MYCMCACVCVCIVFMMYAWWSMVVNVEASVAEQVPWWRVMMVGSQSQWLPSWTEYWWSCSLTFLSGCEVCARIFFFVVHFSLLSKSYLIQTSYPYYTNEFHLVVIKWPCCFITMLKNLLMFSNDILQLDKWEDEDSTQRGARDHIHHITVINSLFSQPLW